MAAMNVSVSEWRERDSVTEYLVQSWASAGEAATAAAAGVVAASQGEAVGRWRRHRDFRALCRALEAASPPLDVSRARKLLPSKMFSTGGAARQPHLHAALQELAKTAADRPELLSFLGRRSQPASASGPGRAATDGAAAADSDSSAQDGSAAAAGTSTVSPTPESGVSEHEERSEAIAAELRRLAAAARSAGGLGAGWKKVGSNKKKGISWHFHAESRRSTVFGVVAHSTPLMISDMVEEEMTKVEPNIKTVRTVAELAGGVTVQHFVMKSIMMTSPRDCIMINRTATATAAATPAMQRADEGADKGAGGSPGQGQGAGIVHTHFAVDAYPGVPEMDTLGKKRAGQTFGGIVLLPASATETFVLIANDMDPRITSIPESYKSYVAEYGTGMLSKNLLNIEKMAKTRDLEAYLVAQACPASSPVSAAAAAPASSGLPGLPEVGRPSSSSSSMPGAHSPTRRASEDSNGELQWAIIGGLAAVVLVVSLVFR